jgi:hypothetical protein
MSGAPARRGRGLSAAAVIRPGLARPAKPVYPLRPTAVSEAAAGWCGAIEDENARESEQDQCAQRKQASRGYVSVSVAAESNRSATSRMRR